MVLFIIGEKIKNICYCKPEVSMILENYVIFNLHN